MNKNGSLCNKCISLFEPKFQKFKIDGILALTLFEYDVLMKDLIYKFKGCYDFELHPIFLETFKNELSFIFYGYKMAPAPSFVDDDRKRGYNHIVEIFKSLKLDMLDVFEKTEKFKQADHNFKDRQKIKKYIKIKENAILPNKILLVDDIYTTGSTMRAMIELLKKRGIKDIKVLILCKTKQIETNHKD